MTLSVTIADIRREFTTTMLCRCVEVNIAQIHPRPTGSRIEDNVVSAFRIADIAWRLRSEMALKSSFR